MRIALVIMDGYEQIVLTPETSTETSLLAKIGSKPLTVKRGQFYHCNGGWYRQGSGVESTILVFDAQADHDSGSAA